MNIFRRIGKLFSNDRKRTRHTHRGVPFTLAELEFVDASGEIQGCDYEYAATELKRRFGGGVFPKELVSLFDDYCANPCLETALDLILFDPTFLVAFVDNKKSKQFRKRFAGSE
ncbi:MAG: hypothetical protein JW818_08340 [Pirellulales bacterium]|nr:hypothetical protein [Pirellulales bacterium]